MAFCFIICKYINPLTPEDAFRRTYIHGVHFALKKGPKRHHILSPRPTLLMWETWFKMAAILAIILANSFNGAHPPSPFECCFLYKTCSILTTVTIKQHWVNIEWGRGVLQKYLTQIVTTEGVLVNVILHLSYWCLNICGVVARVIHRYLKKIQEGIKCKGRVFLDVKEMF